MRLKKIKRFLGLLIFTLLIINFALLQGALAQDDPIYDDEGYVPTADEVKTKGNSEQTEAPYKPLIFKPQVKIPFSNISGETPVGSYEDGKMTSDLLPRYITAIYNYGLAVAGILAAIMLMGGGFLWLSSGGNDSRVSKAKELITGSLGGLVLLLSSWTILNTINPQLLKFTLIKTEVIKMEKFDGNDGFIDNAANMPKDTVIKWVCMNAAYQTCQDTNPATLQLNESICVKSAVNNPKPTNCPGMPLHCCGLSNTEVDKYKDECKDKEAGIVCKINSTTNGTCLEKKCVPDTEKVCCDILSGCAFGGCVSSSCSNDISLSACRSNENYRAFSGGSSKYKCTGLIAVTCVLK